MPTDTSNTFNILYASSSSTPPWVKNIIESTTSEISKYVKSSVKINISVQWLEQDSNVEASCSPNEYRYNFQNCPKKNTLYPIALAEKFANQELNNSSDADIIMKINKNMSWYQGIDGKPLSTEIDLYTILLHELCHGVGFQSNFTVKDSLGYLTGLGLPYIYDAYLIDNKNNYLIDTLKFPSKSKILKNKLTSDSIYFMGKFERAKYLDTSAKIYAPITFDVASSISHLDYKTYPPGDSNSLLNYGKNKGESIHYLGSIVEGILADLGWSDFLLSVNRIKDHEDILYSPEILVYIDSTFDSNTLLLHYSLDNFANEFTETFVKTDTSGYFKATIPIYKFDHNVGYYITVKDRSRKTEVGIPQNYPYNFYSFKLGKDTIKPIITYTPVTEITEDDDSLIVEAKVTDNIGIDSVWINYIINPTSITPSKYTTVKMSRIPNSDNYSGTILLKGKIHEGEYLVFQIETVDSSTNKNRATTIGNDSYGFYEYRIGAKSKPFISLDEDFENIDSSSNRFNISTNIDTIADFSIKKTEGFSSTALHSKHPYPTAIYSGNTINLTATLKNPCTIRSSEAYLDFDEIVLVEPSTVGTVFGDYEFWDYCIIEGSIDKVNWYAFEQKGYKTELFDDWLAVYYSKTITDNSGRISSTAIATESLYHHHKVNLLGNKYLRKGDNVYIRFRLFSDAFVNGWGWVIDNIKIQTTSVNDIILNGTSKMTIFPTISNKWFTISSEIEIKRIEAYSVIGIKANCSIEKSNSDKYIISINGASGMYFLEIRLIDGSVKTIKVLLETTLNE
jgi:hypothetical protein